MLTVSSIFKDFFDRPEDDPLLNENTEEDPAASDATDAQDGEPEGHPSDNAPSDANPPVSGDGARRPSRIQSSDDRSPPDRDSPLPPDTGGILTGLDSSIRAAGVDENDEAAKANAPTPDPPKGDKSEEGPVRTKKFVVPYHATEKDLYAVNDALANGWSFRRIAVSGVRSSMKPQGKKIIITLELDEPRSLFDF